MLYLTFYNMQRLILMFLYHKLVCPEEAYPFADISEYDNNYSAQSEGQMQPPAKVLRSDYKIKGAASSSSSAAALSQHSKRATSAPPLYL